MTPNGIDFSAAVHKVEGLMSGAVCLSALQMSSSASSARCQFAAMYNSVGLHC